MPAEEGALSPIQMELKECTKVKGDRVNFFVDFANAEEAQDMSNMVEKLKNLKTTLLLTNANPHKSMVFKIKTTAPLNYVVKPNSSTLEPQTSTVIDITFVPTEVSRFTFCKLRNV